MARTPEYHPIRNRLGRLTIATLTPPFPMPEIRHMGQWGDFKRLVEGEGKGGIIWYNHTSRAETLALPQVIIAELKPSTPVMLPIALHQIESGFGPALSWLVNHSNAVLCPVITDNTREKYLKKGKPLPSAEVKKQYEKEYLGLAVETLARGGVVAVDPQGTRLPELRIPKMPATSLLARKIKEQGLADKVVNIAVGMTYRNQDRYDRRGASGYNPLGRLDMRFGNVFSLHDILDAKRNEGERWGAAHSRIVIEQIAELLPARLRGAYGYVLSPELSEPTIPPFKKLHRSTVLFRR